jgi:hypothetical protein
VIDIIKRHNRLNGIRFSIAEFGLIALIVGAFAAYYLTHHRAVMAVVTTGLTANCLPVVVIGVRMLMDRTERGNRVPPFWSKQGRRQHLRENPHMLRDTMTLTSATLIPFLALAVVLYELATSRGRVRPTTP